MASPMLSIKYRHPLLLRSLICSAQPYSTAPYSHWTLGPWPLPRNPRNRAAAASASQTTNTTNYTIFPISWQQTQQRVRCEEQISIDSINYTLQYKIIYTTMLRIFSAFSATRPGVNLVPHFSVLHFQSNGAKSVLGPRRVENDQTFGTHTVAGVICLANILNEWMNEWKCGDLKCVQKPTRGRLSLTHLPVQPLSMVRESV